MPSIRCRRCSSSSLAILIAALLTFLLAPQPAAATAPRRGDLLDLNGLCAFGAASTHEQLSLALGLDSNRTADVGEAAVVVDVDEPRSLNKRDALGDQALQKRTNPCGDYSSCSSIGAPSLCCAPGRVCSADYQGVVGCCPTSAACTGTIPTTTGVTTTSTTGTTTAATTTMTTTTTSSSAYTTTTTTTTGTTSTNSGGFVIAGSSTVVVFGQGSGAGALGVPFPARAIMPLLRLPLAICVRLLSGL